MTSQHGPKAGRRNSEKRGGPRTAAGKARASRNALRHGLAATTHRQITPPEEIERFAKALCGYDDNPGLFAQAVRIVGNEMALRAVRAQQVAAIERLREPYAVPFAKRDNSMDLAKAKVMEAWLAERQIRAELPDALKRHGLSLLPRTFTDQEVSAAIKRENALLSSAERKIEESGSAERAHLKELEEFRASAEPVVNLGHGVWMKCADIEPDVVPVRLKALLEETESIDKTAFETARQQIERRDDYAALEAAILDLVRMARYERRAWSRQKRAMREFIKIKAGS